MRSVAFIFMFLLIQAIALPQPCLPEGITFTTQAQIDSFQINYPGCTIIEWDVEIKGNDITNLNGLSVLTSILGKFSIGVYNFGNPILTSLSGLDNINSIRGALAIHENNALAGLTGLENLTYIGGYLTIDGNVALTSLTGLNNLDTIEGHFTLDGNALTSLTGLDDLTYIGGSVWIINNGDLTSFTGLDNLTSIGGGLSIHANFALTSLAGLDNLTSIGESLWIGDDMFGGNYVLTSLTGLSQLVSIGGGIYFNANASLTSLAGLDNIDAASIGDLKIWGNTHLSTCEVLSICNYLASPNGTVVICDNSTGCNSSGEIQDSCEANAVSVKERYLLEDFSISPNPFTTSTTLSYTLDKPSTVTISIFNPQGQLVEKIVQEQPKGEQQVLWNAERLPAGMYYFRIQAGSQSGAGKIIKIK